MLHSQAEAVAFIDECKYALNHLYQALSHRRRALEEISKQTEDLEREEQVQYLIFQERDQWSPNANHLYARYLERIEAIIKQREALSTGTSRTAKLRDLLARIGATEESMSVLGGAVLQIAKQALSFRFGPKPNLSGARLLGSQSIVEVIWEGRNHAEHWEEHNPRQPIQNMLQKLQSELNVCIRPNQNNSLEIIDALGWKTAEAVVSDLMALVAQMPI